MILIADSGGTKTHWVLLDGQNRQEYFTSGLNPTVRPEEDIRLCLQEEIPLDISRVDQVHFFGAGLATAAQQSRFHRILKDRFPIANLHVEDDMMGAARGLCGDEPGGVGILGTGSNACRFDGNRVLAQYGGHGWIMGDEGSGADIGKQILKAALESRLPHPLLDALTQETGMTPIQIRTQVYQGLQVSRFLGTLAKVAVDHRKHPWIQQLLQERFGAYLAVSRPAWDEDVQVHFCGGIAQIFAFELQTACRASGIRAGNILASPMPGLERWILGRSKGS